MVSRLRNFTQKRNFMFLSANFPLGFRKPVHFSYIIWSYHLGLLSYGRSAGVIRMYDTDWSV